MACHNAITLPLVAYGCNSLTHRCFSAFERMCAGGVLKGVSRSGTTGDSFAGTGLNKRLERIRSAQIVTVLAPEGLCKRLHFCLLSQATRPKSETKLKSDVHGWRIDSSLQFFPS